MWHDSWSLHSSLSLSESSTLPSGCSQTNYAIQGPSLGSWCIYRFSVQTTGDSSTLYTECDRHFTGFRIWDSAAASEAEKAVCQLTIPPWPCRCAWIELQCENYAELIEKTKKTQFKISNLFFWTAHSDNVYTWNCKFVVAQILYLERCFMLPV